MEHVPYGYSIKNGHIFYEVHIDSLGHPCIISIKDIGMIGEIRNDFRLWIKQMTDWKLAIKNEQPINSTIVLEFNHLHNWLGISMVDKKKLSEIKE